MVKTTYEPLRSLIEVVAHGSCAFWGVCVISNGVSADLNHTELYYALKVPRPATSHESCEVGDANGDEKEKGVSLAVAVP